VGAAPALAGARFTLTLREVVSMFSRTAYGITFSCLAVHGLASCKQKANESHAAPAPAASASAVAAGPAIVSPNTLHALGQTAQALDYKLTLTAVKECKVKYYFQPKKGYIKLGAEVSVEGTAERQVPVNPFYAELTDAEGETYASTFAGCEPELKSAQVSIGREARGWISFEIPENARRLKFSYAPFVIGRGKQEVTFDLGR